MKTYDLYFLQIILFFEDHSLNQTANHIYQNLHLKLDLIHFELLFLKLNLPEKQIQKQIKQL